MIQPTTNLRIGLFVIAALLLLVGGILALGGSWWFKRTMPAETYLAESVQGLDIGAPVMEFGVAVGRVTGIGFVRNEYPQSRHDPRLSTADRLVVVRMALDEAAFPKMRAGESKPSFMRALVEQGLRAHLAPQGFTGQLYIELDLLNPQQNPVPPLGWQPRSIYIPAVPSTMTKLTSAAEQVLGRLKDADVAHLVTAATSLTEELRATDRDAQALLTSPQVGAILANLASATANLDTLSSAARRDGPQILATAKDVTQHLDRLTVALDRAAAHAKLDHTAESLAVTATDVRRAAEMLPTVLAQAQAVLQQLRLVLGNGSGDLASTLSDLDRVAQNLNDLIATTKAYPSQLFFGEAPPSEPYEPRKSN